MCAAQGQTDRGVHPYNYCSCVFVYVELSTVLTRGIEQASTETKARGEHEVTYHTDTTAAPKRRGCSALPVGCCMWVITFAKA